MDEELTRERNKCFNRFFDDVSERTKVIIEYGLFSGNVSYYSEDMTGAIVDTVDGSKRRLPAWMSSKDTPKNGTSGNLDEICPTAVSNVGSVSREFDALVPEKAKDSENKEMFLEYDSRKNARKSKSGGFNETTSSFGRNRRKLKEEVIGCEQSLSRQHMKFKRAKRNCVKDLSQGMTEDEVELTVEDLISIAEECVSADKEIQHVTRKSGTTSESLGSSLPPIPNDGKLDYAIRSCPVFSKCTQTSTSLLSKPEQKQKGESATFSCNINTQAGDAAQDMLELFLGPLLKKAPPMEPDHQKTEVLISAFESDKQIRSFVDVEKQAPLMKKKSSLKDKVAMHF